MGKDGGADPKRIRRVAFDLSASVGHGERHFDLRALTFANSVPFADAHPGAIQGLYTLYAAGELVYIGHSKDIGRRLNAHRRNVQRWLDRMRAAWMAFADINDARLVEGMVIDRRLWYKPPWNNTRFNMGKEAEQIAQAWFEEKLAQKCDQCGVGVASIYEITSPADQRTLVNLCDACLIDLQNVPA